MISFLSPVLFCELMKTKNLIFYIAQTQGIMPVIYNARGHKLRFRQGKKAQFVTVPGMESIFGDEKQPNGLRHCPRHSLWHCPPHRPRAERVGGQVCTALRSVQCRWAKPSGAQTGRDSISAKLLYAPLAFSRTCGNKTGQAFYGLPRFVPATN